MFHLLSTLSFLCPNILCVATTSSTRLSAPLAAFHANNPYLRGRVRFHGQRSFGVIGAEVKLPAPSHPKPHSSSPYSRSLTDMTHHTEFRHSHQRQFKNWDLVGRSDGGQGIANPSIVSTGSQYVVSRTEWSIIRASALPFAPQLHEIDSP